MRRCARRFAARSRRPAPRSIGRCGCCRPSGATACTRSMPSAARSTTSPTTSMPRRSRRSAALAAWHDEIDAIYAGRPRHLVARALGRAGGALCDAPRAISTPLSTAWRWTRRRTSAPRTWRRSTSIAAGSPARSGICRCMCSAMPSADAHAVADSLGRALQLTNILRDLDEDAQRGRLYLPREILRTARHPQQRAGRGAAPPGPAGGLPRPRGDRRGAFRRRPSGRWRAARAGRCGRPR